MTHETPNERQRTERVVDVVKNSRVDHEVKRALTPGSELFHQTGKGHPDSGRPPASSKPKTLSLVTYRLSDQIELSLECVAHQFDSLARVDPVVGNDLRAAPFHQDRYQALLNTYIQAPRARAQLDLRQ